MRYLICIIFTFSFIQLTYSQKLNIKISADKTIVEEDFPVTIKVESNQPGVLNLNLPASFVKTNTSNSTNRSYDRTTREPVLQYFFYQYGSFNKEGDYKINVTIEINGKRYKTNTIRIKVVKKTPSKKINSKKEYA
jgi:hypothetical protein